MSQYPLRAILVCVDYVDLLAHTLPWNRHHFEEIWVVTSLKDQDTRCYLELHSDAQVQGFYTDAFYEDGATFNKWKALEQGLDAMGRHGWICLMDADVLWPKVVQFPRALEVGRLYSPLRYMLPLVSPPRYWLHDPSLAMDHHPFPPEKDWWEYPVHRNIGEWAGYTQIFHSSDPVLGKAPWHETNWRHAGGADSFFQARWPLHLRTRTSWNVLHLGEAGQNWMGRSTPLLSGQSVPEAQTRANAMQALWNARRGRQGPSRYDHEKL